MDRYRVILLGAEGITGARVMGQRTDISKGLLEEVQAEESLEGATGQREEMEKGVF